MKPTLTRILYLDDNEIDRNKVREILQQEPGVFEVSATGSSTEFEALLHNQKYDLVLCDVNVPGLSDLSALEMVKAFNPEIPVILLTGSNNGQLGAESIRRGAADLIIKSPAILSILSHKILLVMDSLYADEQRRESEQRYNDMIRRIPMGVYIVRAKTGFPGRFEYISPRSCEILGVKADEVLANADVVDLAAHPEDREKFSRARKKAATAGQPFAWEGRFIVSGELRWVRIESEPMFLPDGDTLWNGVVVDITGRKTMEDQLLQNEAIFTSFLENSPVYVFFKDKDIRFLRLSNNYEQMLGMPVHQALGKTMDELFPSELSRSMVADDQRILTEGKRVNVVEEFNGRIYETTKFPIFNDGRPEMLAGFTLDITERIKADRLLQQSEALNQAIISQSPIGIAIFDNKGTPISGNLAWMKIWGISEETYQQELTREFKELGFDEWDEYLQGHIDQVRMVYEKGGSLYLHDLKIPNPLPGSAEWVSQYYYAIMDEQGRVERVITMTEDISARKKAERSLQESETFNQALIVQSPIGIAVFSPTGELKFANTAWKKIWGYHETKYQETKKIKYTELIFNITESYIKDHQDQVRQVFEKGGTLYLRDLKVPNPFSGGADWVSQYYYAILNEQGQVERVITMTEDISTRKKAEAEIIKNRALLARVQEVAQLGSLEINLADQKITAGAVARRIYGFNDEDLSLADFQAIALPEYRSEIDVALEKLIHLNEKFTIQYKIKRRSDGAIRDIQTKAEYNPEEKTVIGSIQDITERKLIMQVLMENEEKFRTLFEHANDMILIFNVNDRILDANQRTCDLLGYSREELLKMKVTDLQAPEVRGSVGTTLKDEFQKYKNGIFESVDLRKDGTTFPVEVAVSKVTGANGIRFFGIIRDVSERKRFEQELKEKIESLERIRDISVDHEQHIKDLELEVNRLLRKAGDQEKYPVSNL